MRCERCGYIIGPKDIGKDIAAAVAALPEAHKILVVDDEAGLPPLVENFFLKIIQKDKLDVPLLEKREKTWEPPRRRNNYKSRRRK